MNSRGHMMLAMIALILFSVAGLGALGQILQHGRIERARRTRQSRFAQLHRAVTLGLHEYRRRLLSVDIAAMTHPATDFFRAGDFPDVVREGCLVHHELTLSRRTWTDRFRRTRVRCVIRAAIPASSFSESAEAACDLLEGEIPVERIAIALPNGAGAETSGDEFLRRNGIVNRSGEKAVVEDISHGDNLDQWLRSTLRLEMETIDWRALRDRLGMDVLDMPIPDGIYVIADGSDVSCIFVQGNLDRLQLDAGDGRQHVTLVRNGITTTATYTPGGADFSAPGTELTGPLIFAEKILINGTVLRLESGSGAAFASGTRLLLAVAGSVFITSNLQERDGGKSQPHLTLLTRARKFFSMQTTSSDVTIADTNGVTLQVGIIAAGKLSQQNKQANISGIVHAAAVENRGKLEIGGMSGGVAMDDYLTSAPYRYLDNYSIACPLEVDDE